MAKVDELRKKYTRITPKTFEKFVESDTTPTKKYLEYLCKVWTNKILYGYSLNIQKLIDAVKEFDKLLPYITNKDIYSPIYLEVNNLSDVIFDANEKKKESNWVRADHVDVIIDNDKYLLLSPKTFEGSLKYGANTRWCTASRNDKSSFINHSKNGTLVYLMAKNISVKNNYEKIAIKLNSQPLCCYTELWNQIDTPVEEKTVINSGWGIECFTEIILASRKYALKKEIVNDAREEVRKVTNFMSTIDFVDFENNLVILNQKNDINVSKTKEIISEFTKKIEFFLK